MCGIVGYIGNKPAMAFLRDGLCRLEYRGYDSHGYGLQWDHGGLLTQRVLGAPSSAPALLLSEKPCPVGIAHTRWATHGPVAIENCHPVCGGKFLEPGCIVVHNGIVENHASLKFWLENHAGYAFSTGTDTEVIAHLWDFMVAEVQRELGRDGDVLREVARRVKERLEGRNAFLLLDRRYPGDLVAVASGMPLVMAKVGEETLVASDPEALAGRATVCRRLSDHIVVFDGEEELSRLPVEDVPQVDTASRMVKGQWMRTEMLEQPALLKKHWDLPILPRPSSVVLTGCGSSLNAAQVVREDFEASVQLPCRAEHPLDLLGRPVGDRSTLVVAISQSGETADVLRLLEEVYPHRRVLLLTNREGTRAASLAHHVVQLGCGPERAVPATKSFFAQVLALEALAFSLTTATSPVFTAPAGLVSEEAVSEEAAAMTRMLDAGKGDSTVMQLVYWLESDLLSLKTLYGVGQGRMLAVAREAALKLSETARVPMAVVSSAELKHGPLALFGAGGKAKALVFYAGEPQTLAAIHELAARGAEMAVVTTADYAERLPALTGPVVKLRPRLPRTIPLWFIVLIQLLSFLLSLRSRLDPDRPVNLAKSVTVS